MTLPTSRPSASALVEAIRFPERLAALPLERWDTLLRLARRTNLVGRLAEVVFGAEMAGLLPPQVEAHLRAAQVLTRHQRQAIAWEVRHIAVALETLPIEAVLLKGAAYASADLQAARGRLFGDVDLLVPAESLGQVEATLMLHGWGSDRSDSYDDRYYRQWMHELPPMVHRKRGTVIDVHHNILPSTARSVPSAERLLKAAVALTETPFRVLAPYDMVIHSATHLFHEGELQNGLRDLFDLDALLTEFAATDAGFWPGLTARAKELGLAWPLALALRYTAAVLGTRIPAEASHVSARTGLAANIGQRLLDAMYLRAFEPDHPLCQTPAASIARLGIFVRGHWLRMPPSRLTLHLGRKAAIRLFKSSSRSR